MRLVHNMGRWIGALSACLMLGMGMTAYASEVSNINIYVKDDYVAGEIVAPTIQLDMYWCEISDISWSKSQDSWKPGKKVQLELSINSPSGRTFSDIYTRKHCKISGADLISARSPDGATLIVKADYVPVVKLGTPERAVWKDVDKTVAYWEKVQYATAYQVKLYEDGNLVQTLTVENNSVDLLHYMKDETVYYYEVRALAKNNLERNYLKDGEFVTSEDIVQENLGDTSGSWKGYPEGNQYLEAGGNYAVNCWKQIYSHWYYFNQDGFAVNGWFNLNNQWYYFDSDGVMKTGWVQINDIWYYLNTSGEMQTGWIQAQPGKWYYLDGSGAMFSNTTTPDGCSLDGSGLWIN